MATTTVAPTAGRKQILTQMTPSNIVTVIPYAASSQQLFRLDRTMSYRSINLRLKGSATTTGANTTAANVAAGDEWSLVSKIEVIANGGNVLRSISGEQLVVLNYLIAGYQKPVFTLAGTAQAYNFDSTLPLWFILPGGIGRSPIDTTLNATLLSDLFLRITWGSGTINSGGSGTTIACTMEVSNDLSFFLDASVVPAYSLTQIQSQQIATNLAVNNPGTNAFQYQLPVGQTYLALLLNYKKTGTTTDAPGCLGTGVIISGTNQLYNQDLHLERYMNQFRQYVPVNSFTNIFYNSANSYDAWTLWVFPKQKLITEALNLVNYQSCQLYLQNTGGQFTGSQAVDINLIPITIIPTKSVTG